jgi:hypothetical protein
VQNLESTKSTIDAALGRYTLDFAPSGPVK